MNSLHRFRHSLAMISSKRSRKRFIVAFNRVRGALSQTTLSQTALALSTLFGVSTSARTGFRSSLASPAISLASPAMLCTLLFLLGTALLLTAPLFDAYANLGDGRTAYNDIRIAEATNAIFTYLEGSFGALVMVVAGVGTILSAAFGQYRTALGLFVVAIGAFILRSIVGTFFNDVGIRS